MRHLSYLRRARPGRQSKYPISGRGTSTVQQRLDTHETPAVTGRGRRPSRAGRKRFMARVRRMDAAARLPGGLPRLATNPSFDAEALRVGVLSQPTSRARRRGSVMRRSLLTADLITLVTVMLFVEAYVAGTAGVTGWTKVAVYMGILVTVIGTMGMYGLYGRDEALADHTTVDDL